MTKAINGGMTTLKEFELAVKNNVKLFAKPIASVTKEQIAVIDNANHKDPKKAFDSCQKYLKMIEKGVGKYGYLVSCGAGIGKTYTIKQYFKAQHTLY